MTGECTSGHQTTGLLRNQERNAMAHGSFRSSFALQIELLVFWEVGRRATGKSGGSVPVLSMAS